MELRHSRRAFVNGAYNLRRKASIANLYSELRLQLFVGSEARFFMRHCSGNDFHFHI